MIEGHGTKESDEAKREMSYSYGCSRVTVERRGQTRGKGDQSGFSLVLFWEVHGARRGQDYHKAKRAINWVLVSVDLR